MLMQVLHSCNNRNFYTFGFHKSAIEKETINNWYSVHAGVETSSNARIFIISEKLHCRGSLFFIEKDSTGVLRELNLNYNRCLSPT
jgi:hypothetical protein